MIHLDSEDIAQAVRLLLRSRGAEPGDAPVILRARGGSFEAEVHVSVDAAPNLTLEHALTTAREGAIARALSATNGNVCAAARMLDVHERSLFRHLAKRKA